MEGFFYWGLDRTGREVSLRGKDEIQHGNRELVVIVGQGEGSDLNEFLSELRAIGVKDSEGSFTVSLETAEEKLKKFRLPDPRHYIVQIVAAAVASGASFLKIDPALTQIEFICDGRVPNLDELRSLNQYLFESMKGPAYLTELALGVQAALTLPARRVLVESYTAEGSWQLELRGREQRLVPLDLRPPVMPLMRLVVDKGFGLTTRLVNPHTELEFLHLCRQAPLHLTVEDVVKVSMPAPPEGTVAWTQLSREDGSFNWPCQADLAPIRSVRNPHVSGFLALFITGKRSPGISLVHHGVTMKPMEQISSNRVCGIAYLGGLRKDISQINLVQDAVFEEIQEFLKNEIAELYTAFCRTPLETRDLWKKMTPIVQSFLARAELSEPQRKILEDWLFFVEVAHAKKQEGFAASLDRARDLDRLGEWKLARQLRVETYQKLRKSVLEHLEKMNWAIMEDHLQLLIEVATELESPNLHQLRQAQQLLRGLVLGQGPDPAVFSQKECWTLHRRALLHRMNGEMREAFSLHALLLDEMTDDGAWALRFCGELHLLKGNHKEAYDYWLRGVTLKGQTTYTDLLEDLFFLSRFVSEEGRKECVSFLRELVALEQRLPFVQRLLLEYLAAESRGVLSWDTWISVRAKASFAGLSLNATSDGQDEVEERLSKNFDLFGWKSLDKVRAEKVEAVTIAEQHYGPNHPYTQFTRRRAFYQLHRLGCPEPAEEILCRGHLLAQLQHCVQGEA